MKTTLFVYPLFLIGISASLSAQESVNTAGADISNNSGSITASVGQTFYETSFSGQGSASAGVQQPYEIIETLGTEIAEISLSLNIYPNPTQDVLNLTLDFKNYNSYRYDLFDGSGKLITGKTISQAKTSIQMAALPAAIYYLKVSLGGKVIKIFKVVKSDK